MDMEIDTDPKVYSYIAVTYAVPPHNIHRGVEL